MVNESLLKAGRKGPLPGYGGSRRLLVEFFFDISRTTALKWTDELLAMGYQIVLAHPERYDFAKTAAGGFGRILEKRSNPSGKQGEHPGRNGKKSCQDSRLAS